jgi:hypothetical protein
MGHNANSGAAAGIESKKFRPEDVQKAVPNAPSANTLRKWVDSERLELTQKPKPGTMTRYTYKDLIRVCAWAELNRIGIVPYRAPLLLAELERELSHAPKGLIVAWVLDRLDDEPEVVRMRVRAVTREQLRFVFLQAQPEDVAHVTSTVVIDVAKLRAQFQESLIEHLASEAKP